MISKKYDGQISTPGSYCEQDKGRIIVLIHDTKHILGILGGIFMAIVPFEALEFQLPSYRG